MGSKPVIISLGFRARSGKGEIASFLKSAYGGCNLVVLSFASALRKEIHDEVHKIAAEFRCPPREALEVLCQRMGVKFDPFAKPDQLNPYSKQRYLMQVWGTELRRKQDPDYWLGKVAEQIEKQQPGIVIIDDMRFHNEAEWVKARGGVTVHVHRPDNTSLDSKAAAHASEHDLVDHKFDFTVLNDGSLKQLHERANKVFHAVSQRKLFT